MNADIISSRSLKTETYVDKSSWPKGPWNDEPDKVQWGHSGLDCLIVRGPTGALCGYVGVPEQHPFFEKDYSSVDVDVHGGLTFADRCQDGGHICHHDGLNDIVWWLGFDCAHYRDVRPRWPDRDDDGSATYKDLAFVIGEVERLAVQLVTP